MRFPGGLVFVFGFLVGLVFILGLLGLGNCQEDRTCTYTGVCQREITVNQPCNLLPPCENITINVPCLKTEPCNSNFDPWSGCSVTCEVGVRSRFGRCCGPSCTKTVSETESCDTMIPCGPVDGNWASWNTWTAGTCSASCCGGITNRTRTRTCTDPPPNTEGAFCTGNAMESETEISCNEQDCPVVCDGSELFLRGPCDFCTERYVRCDDGPSGNKTVASMQVCDTGKVWSVGFNSCVIPQICSPPAAPSAEPLS